MVELSRPTRDFPPNVILTAVAQAFDVSLETLTSEERRRIPDDARAAAIILLADLCHLTPPQIGDLVGPCETHTVTETIARTDQLLRDPIWAGLYLDAVEEVTGVRPPEPPRILSYQGYPVRILETEERSVLLQFIGPTPLGFTATTRISRTMLRPAPDLGRAAHALQDYLVWARRLLETESAWPALAHDVRAAERALSTLSGKSLPADANPLAGSKPETG